MVVEVWWRVYGGGGVVEGLGSRVDPSQTKGIIQPESGGLNMSFPISL